MIYASGKEGRKEKVTYPKIPWIDQKCIFHMLANTHKLAQHKRRIIRPALGNHKLHAGGIHPVPERRDHSKVSYTQQSIKFVFLQGLVATIYLFVNTKGKGGG